MIIRNEQLAVFEGNAEEDFVQRLATHLREDYPDAVVRRSENEAMVYELSDENLYELIRVSIKRARSHELTFESSISAFSAIMFEVAPNFDEHNLSSLCLKDENIEPNDRLDEILKIFTETHWEKVRSNYDVTAWEPIEEETENVENTDDVKTADNLDLAETQININEDQEKEKALETVRNLKVGETFFTPESTRKPKDVSGSDDLDLDETIVNFDID